MNLGADQKAEPWPMREELAQTLAASCSNDFASRWPAAPVTSQAFELFLHGFLEGAKVCGAIATNEDAEWWYERVMKRIFAVRAQ